MDFSKEDWQEFREEVIENLAALEQNLLLLEDNPRDEGCLNECFRLMHSVKGASGYIGLSAMSTLAHGVEDLFDKVRGGELDLTKEAFDCIFLCLDRLKDLLDTQIKEDAEPKSKTVDDLLRRLQSLASSKKTAQKERETQLEKRKDVSTRDLDQELITVFHDEMKSLLARIDSGLSQEKPTRKDLRPLIGELKRLLNYIGLKDGLHYLEDVERCIPEGDDEVIDKVRLREVLAIFMRSLPVDFGFNVDALGERFQDEDRELYQIFVDHLKELSGPLREVPDTFNDKWAIECQESLEAIKASANYMDYRDLVELLEEWEERLVESLSGLQGDRAFEPHRFRDLWDRIVRLFPELASVEDSTSVQEEDDAVSQGMDLVFEGLLEAPSEGKETEEDKPKGLSRPKQKQQPYTKAHMATEQHITMGPPDLHGSIRISIEKVDSLVVDVGDLAVLRTGIGQVADELRTIYSKWIERRVLPPSKLKPLKDLVMRLTEHSTRLDRVSKHLQDQVLDLRMIPVYYLFQRIPRQVRDLCRQLGKEVDLQFTGQETTLDKQVMEALTDPMNHIVRNALDHGIEDPQTRKTLGKAPAGRLSFHAGHQGNFVVIEITDDGKGIDPEILIEKALKKGLLTDDEAQDLSPREALDLVFLPEMTTREKASQTSGRGVGMDVVKRNIENLGGTISLISEKGKGTSVIIRIPLTLAIVPALVIDLGGQKLGIPMNTVEETLRIRTDQITGAEGREVISVRQRPVPLLRLERMFSGLETHRDNSTILAVMVRHGDMEAAINADSLLGQHELVIKPLKEHIIDKPGFSGAATLGDGSIALILDVPQLLERAGLFLKGLPLKEQATG